MEITGIRIRKMTEGSKLKAYVTLTFDDCFVVHNVKIIRGQDGLIIAMPSRITSTGEYKDIAHPITPEFRGVLQEKILEKYFLGGEEDGFTEFREIGHKNVV